VAFGSIPATHHRDIFRCSRLPVVCLMISICCRKQGSHQPFALPTHLVGDGKLLDCQAATALTMTLAVSGTAPTALTIAACALLTSG
jgi:hypothetical protein